MQVLHDAWQAVQVACEPTSCEKVPVVGQAEMHAPDERNDLEGCVQLRHCVADGPLHVVHEASQGSHTLDVLAYLPTGVHEARQVP